MSKMDAGMLLECTGFCRDNALRRDLHTLRARLSNLLLCVIDQTHKVEIACGSS
jgi:hypothetical protein